MANLSQFLVDLEGEADFIRKHGPFECPRCNEPYDDVTAYCRKCGYVTHVFAEGDGGGICSVHSSERATDYCCLCSRPVCQICKQEYKAGETPRSYRCKDCVSKLERLEQEFLKDIRERHVCPRHRDIRSQLTCRECGLPVCKDCAYVWVEGLFFKHIINGPFCNACKFKSFPRRPRLKLRSVSDCLARKMKIPNL